MTNFIRTITLRDPESFKQLDFLEVSNRSIFRKEEDTFYRLYEPEVVSLDEIKDKLRQVGELNKVEQFLCPYTLNEIIRGYVVKEDKKEYYFCLISESGKYLKSHVDYMIQMLSLSGRSTENKTIDSVITIKEYPND